MSLIKYKVASIKLKELAQIFFKNNQILQTKFIFYFILSQKVIKISFFKIFKIQLLP